MDPKQLLSNVNANGLVGKMLSGMATKNFAAGLLAGGIGGSLIKKDAVEDIAKLGGLALLGTLAYKAYNSYQQDKSQGVGGAVKSAGQGMVAQAGGLLAGAKHMIANAQAASAPQAALPAPAHSEALQLAIIRAMIAAAKADGAMDDAEMQKIMGHVEQGGMSNDEKMLLMREMASAHDVATIASGAATPEEAAEIYLAALLVCDSQCAAEQQFLSRLAAALRLEPAFAQNLQRELLAMANPQAA
jgi:uncharacterized membrane protein YebE (DUF533 family)